MAVSVNYLLLQSTVPMYVLSIDHFYRRGVILNVYLLITTDQSFTGLCINTCTWNYQQAESEIDRESDRETEIGSFSHVQGETDGLGYGLE